MKSVRLAVVFLAATLFGSGPNPLNVIRVHPTSGADPRTEITVTFDRPVAGGLDAAVDPAGIFRIEPAVAGRVEWRDPVTLRFEPSSPLEPGASYRVTVSDDFQAMDGARLRGPYSFVVRIDPARVLAGDPIGTYALPRFIAPRPVISVLFSATVDPRVVAGQSLITMDAPCAGAGIRLEPVRVRRVGEEDPPELRYSGGYYAPGDSARDLRRVVELRPVSPLPRGCGGTLSVPHEARGGAAPVRWPFRTYGPLQVDSVVCGRRESCPTGPVRVVFSTPVSGAEVQRRVRVHPNIDYTIADTGRVSHEWVLEARLQPRERYAVVVDSLMTDIFDQKLGAAAVRVLTTTSYAPTVTYEHGRMIVERNGARTLAVQVVNVDTLVVTTIPVPASAEATFLSQTRRWGRPVEDLRQLAVEQRIAVRSERDQPQIVGLPIPPHDAQRRQDGTLLAVQVRHAGQARDADAPIALLQVTDLAVHGRLGVDDGAVWVTGVGDGRPRANVAITVHDAAGQVRARARTDEQGLARLNGLRPLGNVDECEEVCNAAFDGYVAAVLGDDRAVVGFNAWDPDLAAWNFGVSSAWSVEQRIPAAAAVFTERGIYRPGERVHAKAIVRNGALGALTVPRGDSIRWEFLDREYSVTREVVTPLSPFGTGDESIVLPADVPLGAYTVRLGLRHAGEWRVLSETTYQVAEYRPPDFLVDVNADAAPRFAGDSVATSISARYLFGAPMAGARVRWLVQHRPMSMWEMEIPNSDGWQVGGYSFDEPFHDRESTIALERVDSLDARGTLDIAVRMPAPEDGRAARTGIVAVVTDANRQTVTAGRTIIVHPAAFYIGARSTGAYFWRAGTPVDMELIALTPTGERVSGVSVQGVIVRREWHRARRIRNGQLTEVGGWVTDTVATCRVETAAAPVGCRFTPAAGGTYMAEFTARDAQGRTARTMLWRWAAGAGFVPWRDDTKLRMEIIADRQRYAVGDTATLLIASPFTDVEGWLTVERERVLESRRIRITAGATTVRVPITEGLAPNAFVSVLLVRGRSAEPGPLDDPGRPTMRVGYTELRVLPDVKRLAVQVAPAQPEYRPGDTARVSVRVTSADGAGQRAEVTLWAVDEGVLALTGYTTPDPVELLYRTRPLGTRLSSNLVAVAAQVPAGQKGARAAGGGGGLDVGGVLRSRFQTTAFFLGSVVTDADGQAVASARLPDNLTTFRIMAVAVTAGDRYGSGSASMLVSRPLVARPALPRFLREGDRFAAGVVVNQRTGGNQNVDVEVAARGVALEGPRRKRETLRGAAPGEVTFDFTAQAGDSAFFEFGARGREHADAVAVRLPIRPAHHPLARTIAGVLRDSTTAEFVLDADVDPARTTLELSFGSSTAALIRGSYRALRVYPYYCTEQVSSSALPLIALYRAQQQHGIAAPATAEADIRAAIRVITRRQNADGGIGYWSANDWSTPWLTAYASRVLLEARAAGFAVDSLVLDRAAEYLARSVHQNVQQPFAVSHWHGRAEMVLAERVAAADMLSRLGRPDVPLENTLLGRVGQLRWEERVLLAETLARRGAVAQARPLLTAAWQDITSSGRTLVLPAAARDHYFMSAIRPAARLLAATLAIEPEHPLLGQLVETLVQHGRAAASYTWNTQDYGAAVLGLMEYERRRERTSGGRVRVDGARGMLLSRNLTEGESRDTSFAIAGLNQGSMLRLRLSADGPAPVYYFLTVREVPRTRPVRPVDNGIQVERWYERVDSRQPVTSVAAGELVRVRLRLTVPNDRQFVVLDDPLPAGLEAVDLSLRTVRPPGTELPEDRSRQRYDGVEDGWYFGSWDSGVWSVFDHKELRDDRVVYFATYLWTGTHTATYLARATTAGTFAMPPAHAEEMYNPAVNGRTGGGDFVVTPARR